MNTKEINPGTNGTLPIYVAFAAPLTILTIWVITAFQSCYFLGNISFWARLAWPWLVFEKWWTGKRSREARTGQIMDRAIHDDYDEEMIELKPNYRDV
jgi:hypothetical protein